MTQYLNKSFSVQLGGEKYRDGWDRIFGTCGSAAEPLICNETDAGSTPAGCSELQDEGHDWDDQEEIAPPVEERASDELPPIDWKAGRIRK